MAAPSHEMKGAVDRCLKAIEARAIEGGFAGSDGGTFRPDATAWAILALRAAGVADDRLYPPRDRLAGAQAKDGSVGLAPGLSTTVWPTPLAILAWQGAAPFAGSQSRAVEYLLASGGVRWDTKPDEGEGSVDPRIRGWPWVTGTFSWVEPTALAIMALSASGHASHARVDEALRVLMDRQVSVGGWNFGGTRVYRSEHAPLPESTGLVLVALAGRIGRDVVAKALEFAKRSVSRHRTPLALGWCLLGLTAWAEEPDGAHALVAECLDRESRYGGYDTTHFALLALALMAHHGGTGPLFSEERP